MKEFSAEKGVHAAQNKTGKLEIHFLMDLKRDLK